MCVGVCVSVCARLFSFTKWAQANFDEVGNVSSSTVKCKAEGGAVVVRYVPR